MGMTGPASCGAFSVRVDAAARARYGEIGTMGPLSWCLSHATLAPLRRGFFVLVDDAGTRDSILMGHQLLAVSRISSIN
jgi:hypothetical protein